MTASGTNPAATTPDDVKRWLTAFFIALPDAPVFSARQGEARFLDPEKSASAFDWTAFSAQVLGRASRERLFLLTYARCQARRRAIARNLPNPPAGGTVAEFCVEFRISRGAFEQSVRRSLVILAREWDRRRGNG